MEISDKFALFCESLWREWLDGTLDTPEFVRTTFNLDAAPEPYISFDAGEEPLVALTTNPGATMPHQRRDAVQAGHGPLSTTIDYATAAKALRDFYKRNLAGTAQNRITALQLLSTLVARDGVLQVEACPFRSRYLPKKDALLQALDTGGLLARYVKHVEGFLRRRPVVIVTAVSSRASLEQECALSPWAKWMAITAGLSLERADFIP